MRNADILIRAISEFNKMEPNASVKMLWSFLLIAKSGDHGITSSAIARALAVEKPSVTQFTRRLSTGRPGVSIKGLGLIRTIVDPTDKRYTPSVLTPKGRELYNRMMS